MLKADLHLHTRFSPDSRALPQAIVERCLTTGLNCIAVTDHNTIQGALETQSIAPFRVIVGEEVKSSGGDIIGLYLQEAVPKGLSALDTVKAIKAQGGLVMIPHPFDRLRPSAIKYGDLEHILPFVDLVEVFNAHNLLRRDNERAGAFGRKHNLVETAVSDSHTPRELGRTYMEFPEYDGSPEGLKAALSKARLVTHRASPLLRLATMYAKTSRIFR